MKTSHYKFPTAIAIAFLSQACGSSAAQAPLTNTPVANASATDAQQSEPGQATAASTAATSSATSEVAPSAETSAATVDLLADEMAAYAKAKPIFEEHCAMCHTPKSGRKKQKESVEHFSMASYPFAGHHQAMLGQSIREVLGGSGKAATMPANDPGAVQGNDLVVVLDWADAFASAANAGVGYHAAMQNMAEDDDDDDDEAHEHKKKSHEHKEGHEHKKKSHEHKEGHEHK